MATLRAPNPKYTGITAGVTFVRGLGHTTDTNRIDWLVAHGYVVESEPMGDKYNGNEGEDEDVTPPAPINQSDTQPVPANKKPRKGAENLAGGHTEGEGDRTGGGETPAPDGNTAVGAGEQG